MTEIALEKLDRLRQMADEAERENPAEPIDELLDVQRALRRVIRQVRRYQAAGLTVQAGKLAVRVTGMCGELAGLLASPADVDAVATPTTVSYRDAAVTLWGEAGALAHDTYARLRPALYPELPAQLPIVIGITAYGHCAGLTRHEWEHGPRITVSSSAFARGDGYVTDLMVHEMLHVRLGLAGRSTAHDGHGWYDEVRRLSPAVLGSDVDARRGAGRRSARVPNPAYAPGNGKPKTLVRKRPAEDAVPHAHVAGWPQAFRPEGHDWGTPVPCPTY